MYCEPIAKTMDAIMKSGDDDDDDAEGGTQTIISNQVLAIISNVLITQLTHI